MQKITGTFDLPQTFDKKTGRSSVKFPGGNTLVVDQFSKEIKLFSKDEVVQLVITIGEKGLSVNINAAELNIHSTNELNLSSKKINIDASEQLNIHTAGNLVQQIGKDYLTETAGTNKNIARVQKLTANLGNVEIKANDDVKLNGESVKLNSDD